MEQEGVAKLSVSVPAGLAAEIRKHVRGRGLSAFAARAMRHELEREMLGAYLAELEEAIGAADEAIVAEADRLWPAT